MSTDSQTIALVGMFPPPTTGAAKNNLIMFEDLTAAGVDVVKLSTSGVGMAHKRGLAYHLERVGQNLKVAVGLFRLAGRGHAIYIVPDAGLGMAYSVIHTLLGRLLFRRIIIHHRSFRYIDSTSPFMKAIVGMTRDRALHVFLSDRMGDQFAVVYGPVKRLTVTNAHYVADAIASCLPPPKRDGLVVGHLSNLCRDKGFYDVIEVFERLAGSGADIRLHLAGPPIDAEVQCEIDRLQAAWPERFSHAGPLYGDAKHAFYRQLDIFLFPTHHAQEAQPNVIYEALAAGVPVLATPRGCIPEMVGGPLGAVSPTEEDFVDWCEEKLRTRPVSVEVDRAEILRRLGEECVASRSSYLELQRALLQQV